MGRQIFGAMMKSSPVENQMHSKEANEQDCINVFSTKQLKEECRTSKLISGLHYAKSSILAKLELDGHSQKDLFAKY